MYEIYNKSNLSYIIQISSQSGIHHGYMRIDQNAGIPLYAYNMQRINNGVQAHLNHLSKKTGMAYHVIYEGSPEMATAILEVENDCPF